AEPRTRRGGLRLDERRFCSKPASPGCSRPATSAAARSSAARLLWARARSPSASCISTLGRRCSWQLAADSWQPAAGSQQLARHELLSAVDVVRRAGEGGVGHDVYGQRSDVGRSNDAPDWKRGAELVATAFELVAEKRCRQGRVDEAGGDQVDPN